MRMGLFSNLGKQFEKTKRAFTTDEQTDYVCASCEKPIDDDYEHCPHCGEQAVEPVA